MSGLLRVKAPSWDGAMLMGPLRRSRYSRPMPALPIMLLAMVFSVLAPLILYTERICK